MKSPFREGQVSPSGHRKAEAIAAGWRNRDQIKRACLEPWNRTARARATGRLGTEREADA